MWWHCSPTIFIAICLCSWVAQRWCKTHLWCRIYTKSKRDMDSTRFRRSMLILKSISSNKRDNNIKAQSWQKKISDLLGLVTHSRNYSLKTIETFCFQLRMFKKQPDSIKSCYKENRDHLLILPVLSLISLKQRECKKRQSKWLKSEGFRRSKKVFKNSRIRKYIKELYTRITKINIYTKNVKK